ncbi:ATP-binding protein [Aquimarina sp. AU58]|uniref:ATP-binding protein n=1 Tax=Aquimarina sp. AU58 TaxID=1874112 RepID=UPI000D64CAC9|nr:ATP-binding protein [Aquimarina sp. AU58]
MQRQIFIVVIWLIFIFSNIHAQKKNDYCEMWRKQGDTITNMDDYLQLNHKMISKVDVYCQMDILTTNAFIYREKRKIDSALYYYDQAIKLGKQDLNDEQLSLKPLTNKAYLLALSNKNKDALTLLRKSRKILNKYPGDEGWILYYQTYAYMSDVRAEYHDAIKYTDSSITLSERYNLVNYIHSCYANRGTYYLRISDFESAAKNLLRGIEESEKIGSSSSLEAYNYMLATCYLRLKQYEVANKYYKIAISKSKKIGNDYVLMHSYSKIADSYIALKSPYKALKVIDSALVLINNRKDNGLLAKILNTKGSIYFDNLKDYDKAEKCFIQAYEAAIIADSSKKMDDLILVSAIESVVKIYLYKKNYRKTKKYLTLLESKVKKTGILTYNRSLHRFYSKYFEGTGQLTEALSHLKKYQAINDSISNEKVKTQVADLEKKYDTQKKELEIVKLNKEKEAQELTVQRAKAKQNLYMLAAFFLLFVLVIGIWAFRKLQKQQKELTSINQVKNRLFSIIAHDLRGMMIPFQRSGKILKHHIDQGNHQRTIELSKELEKNSESLSNMLDNLLNWSLEQMNGYRINPERMSVREQFEEIITAFKQRVAYKNTDIELKYEEDVSIKFDKGAFHVIFRNLIGNALKYTENGNIRIEFKNDFNTLLCSVSDTGEGMSEEQLKSIFTLEEGHTTIGTQGEKGTGLGLNLVYRFVSMNKGTIKVSSKKRIGTRFDLSFPAAIPIELKQNTMGSRSA